MNDVYEEEGIALGLFRINHSIYSLNELNIMQSAYTHSKINIFVNTKIL